MVPPLPSSALPSPVVARARARRRQRGASMFVVAVTLGLLGAMGVYGLGATASDFRAAAHLREGLHAQRAAEEAMVISAEAFNPMTAPRLVEELTGGARGSTCKYSARAYSGATNDTLNLNVEGCLSLKMTELKTIINGASVNGVTMSGTGNWADGVEPFTSESFFPPTTNGVSTQPLAPTITVEVTNAAETAVPPGFDAAKDVFYELTVTPVAKMTATSGTGASESTALGRGRIVVGPARPMRRIAGAP